MPNLPISQLPQSTTLQGNELFVDVQGGVTKYTTLDNVADYVTSSFDYVTPAQTGSFVESAYISMYSSASQALAVSGSSQPVTFTSLWTNEGITLENNKTIRFAKAGTYQLNFNAQIANSANAIQDAWIWIKYNGNDFPNSTKRMTLQARKNATTPSGQTMSISILGVALNDNDYIELHWTGDAATTTSLRATPANTYPASPSIIADIVRVK